MVCSKCGYQNSQGATYCSGCGSSLDGSNDISGGSQTIKPRVPGTVVRLMLRLVLLVVEFLCFYYIVAIAIIPLFMQGLIMVSGTTPALRAAGKEVNLFLGNLIHATKDTSGIWTTTYGVSINPSCAASSLELGLFQCASCLVFTIAYLARLAKTVACCFLRNAARHKDNP